MSPTSALALDRRTLLGRVWLFSGLSGRDLDLLVEYTLTKPIGARKEVFHKGDDGDAAYAILSGRLKATARSPEGREITFSIMDPGEVFGEIAMLGGVERTATVTALERSELLVIRRRDLLAVLERQPDIALKCLTAVSQRLVKLSQNMEDALLRDFPSRLARKLLTLSDNYGSPEGQGEGAGTRIDVKLSQTELGNMVGTSRESVNKQMKAWERDGLLTSADGIITLRDRDRLEDLAGVFGF